jgi:nitroimidazol reductase NimA-like FMN-containing flavoprotein (pyridoxamine 5'-phosphate oxidase superfamily)
MTQQPETTIDERYSSPGATATPWSAALKQLETAEIYWLSTVRPDGRPHCTPLIAVWLDGSLLFSTGDEERKYRNLAENRNVLATTGTNVYASGLDVVLEGVAEQVTDMEMLRRAADAYVAKYGEEWRFVPEGGRFLHPNGQGRAEVFAIRPVTVLGFARGETFSQTRWRFAT